MIEGMEAHRIDAHYEEGNEPQETSHAKEANHRLYPLRLAKRTFRNRPKVGEGGNDDQTQREATKATTASMTARLAR